MVDVSFSDTGVGIQKEAMDKIFDPFFTTRSTGTGLGLPISVQIVREVGGALTAKNNPTGGATFRVSFPVPAEPPGKSEDSGKPKIRARPRSEPVKISVLVVDDELLIRKSLSRCSAPRATRSRWRARGGRSRARANLRPHVMILDMRLPDTDGLSVLRRVRQLDPLVQVIVFTAFGDVQSAVDAMKLGACDFLRKPYEMEDIVLADEGAARTFRQANELDLYRRQACPPLLGQRDRGHSGPMREVRELIDKVVRSQATSVLITGESGTGKELVARAIHYRSDRASAPLMEVNCSSFHESLLENELFGHEKGAFTDASDTKKGLVELCDRGTLFLDEVADMPLATQSKLLRFIDTGASSGWAAARTSRSTSASSPPPTRTSRAKSAGAGSEATSTSA
jgi:FixJ family two-component response regulator